MENLDLNIKERVLQICDYKQINKETFFKALDISYANFKGVQKKSTLNSDTIAKIISNYDDINPVWLICGTGNMLKENLELSENENSNNSDLLELHDRVIDLLERKIKVLEQRLIDKSMIIETLEIKMLLIDKKSDEFKK
ncbi:hypothetical protein [Flavobacterium psychrophilum]|uniref:hypothetical protein n=1 Tax=Flavobacterium psychrophilum TaxID=96345 RepID=UPI00106C0C2A|nr:hypothetical protein [Flavobacterium psychrophilum]